MSKLELASAEVGTRPGRRAYVIFGVLALASLTQGLDFTIVAVALPNILTDLGTSLALVSWTITGGQFAQSISMPIAGKLSDEWGRKRLFMAAVAVFTAGSLAASLAPNIITLIIFRVIQGIGAGAFMPSTMGVVSDTFGERRATAIGLVGAIFPIGGILGPNIGGLIIDKLSWHWVFLVNVPIGILLLVLAGKFFPRSTIRSRLSARSIDLTGIALFVGAVLSILFAITGWANDPAGERAGTWALFALGAVLFAIFIRYESQIPQPLIDIKLLRWRPFIGVNVYNFFLGAAMFGMIAFVPYYATVSYGMTAGQNGILLTPRAIGTMVMTVLSSLFLIRFRYRAPMVVGSIFIAISLVLLSRGWHDVLLFGNPLSDLALLALIVAINGIGIGMVNPAASNAALDLIPEKVAAVTGMRGLFRILGGVTGAAMITLILSYFPDKGQGMQNIYLGFAVLLVLLIPVLFLIPDRKRGRHESMATAPDTLPPG